MVQSLLHLVLVAWVVSPPRRSKALTSSPSVEMASLSHFFLFPSSMKFSLSLWPRNTWFQSWFYLKMVVVLSTFTENAIPDSWQNLKVFWAASKHLMRDLATDLVDSKGCHVYLCIQETTENRCHAMPGNVGVAGVQTTPLVSSTHLWQITHIHTNTHTHGVRRFLTHKAPSWSIKTQISPGCSVGGFSKQWGEMRRKIFSKTWNLNALRPHALS